MWMSLHCLYDVSSFCVPRKVTWLWITVSQVPCICVSLSLFLIHSFLTPNPVISERGYILLLLMCYSCFKWSLNLSQKSKSWRAKKQLNQSLRLWELRVKLNPHHPHSKSSIRSTFYASLMTEFQVSAVLGFWRNKRKVASLFIFYTLLPVFLSALLYAILVCEVFLIFCVFSSLSFTLGH